MCQKDVFEKVESDFETIKTRTSESLWQILDREYPKMPTADKKEVHRRVSSRDSKLVGKSTRDGLALTIHYRIRDLYTPPLNLNDPKKEEANSKRRQRIEKILVYWRGEAGAISGWSLTSIETEAGLPTTQPPRTPKN